jgi:serine O-acetyltransferase
MEISEETDAQQGPEADGSRTTLFGLIREDWVTHGRAWTSPGFQTLAAYRFGRWQMVLPKPLRLITDPIYLFWYVLTRNLYGIELPRKAQVGRRFHIAHQGGIVISDEAIIGDDCMIRQNVTIGAGGQRSRRGRRKPTLGDGVEIGPGAAIVGGISLGDGVRVGPNAVVMTNVPPGASVFAPPARTLGAPGGGSGDE